MLLKNMLEDSGSRILKGFGGFKNVLHLVQLDAVVDKVLRCKLLTDRLLEQRMRHLMSESFVFRILPLLHGTLGERRTLSSPLSRK